MKKTHVKKPKFLAKILALAKTVRGPSREYITNCDCSFTAKEDETKRIMEESM
jgi:hypothetical protein